MKCVGAMSRDEACRNKEAGIKGVGNYEAHRNCESGMNRGRREVSRTFFRGRSTVKSDHFVTFFAQNIFFLKIS